jgi:hypothetical protein
MTSKPTEAQIEAEVSAHAKHSPGDCEGYGLGQPIFTL